jgi:hypothetical protein
MELNVWLSCLKYFFLTLRHTNPFQALPRYFFKTHLSVIFPLISSSVKKTSSFRFPHKKMLCAFFHSPKVPLAQPLLFFLTSKALCYSVRRQNSKIPHLAVFFTLLLLHRSYPKRISSSATHSRISPAHILPSTVTDHNIVITSVKRCDRGASDQKGRCYVKQEGLSFTALFYPLSARAQTQLKVKA